MIYHILLASGLSRRFGGNKLLYPVDGIPMYLRALRCAVFVRRRLGTRIIFVTSSRELAKRAVMEAAKAEGEGHTGRNQTEEPAGEYWPSAGIQAVLNNRPEEGISRSIRLGIQAAGAGPEDWLLFSVCDQPWLTGEEVCRLAERALSSGRGIAALSRNEEAGNPVLFKGSYADELLALTGDRGGKAVLKRHWEDVLLVEAEHEKSLQDLDERP